MCTCSKMSAAFSSFLLQVACQNSCEERTETRIGTESKCLCFHLKFPFVIDRPFSMMVCSENVYSLKTPGHLPFLLII